MVSFWNFLCILSAYVWMNPFVLGFTLFIVLFEDSSKATIHLFGVLCTKTNVMSETLVATSFPFRLLLHFPGDW